MNGFSVDNPPPPGPFDDDGRPQRILNSKDGPGPWPNAVVHEAAPAIRVRVRLVWERDGVEYLDTVATRWGGLHVLVGIRDRRWRVQAVWLHCDDVGRR